MQPTSWPGESKRPRADLTRMRPGFELPGLPIERLNSSEGKSSVSADAKAVSRLEGAGLLRLRQTADPSRPALVATPGMRAARLGLGSDGQGWQRAEGDCNVQISLAAEPKTVTLDGQAYPAAIDKVDMGVYSVHLKVETETGKSEEWIIRQVWDDNGTSFSLAFTHNGTQEKLVNCGHS